MPLKTRSSSGVLSSKSTCTTVENNAETSSAKRRGRPKRSSRSNQPSTKKQFHKNIENTLLDQTIAESTIPEKDDTNSLTCSICRKDFTSEFILYLHMKIHNKVRLADMEQNEKNYEPGEIRLDDDETALMADDGSDLNSKEFEEKKCKPEERGNCYSRSGSLNQDLVKSMKKNLSLALLKRKS